MTIVIDSVELTGFGMIDNLKWCDLIGWAGLTPFNGAIWLANHCFSRINNLVWSILQKTGDICESFHSSFCHRRKWNNIIRREKSTTSVWHVAKDLIDFNVFRLIKARAPVEQAVHDVNTSFARALNYQNTRKMQCTKVVMSVIWISVVWLTTIIIWKVHME